MFVHRDLESHEKELISLRAAWAESLYPVSEDVWMTKHFMNAGDVGK